MVQWGRGSRVAEIYWRILGLFGKEVRGFGGFVQRGFMSSEVYWEGIHRFECSRCESVQGFEIIAQLPRNGEL